MAHGHTDLFVVNLQIRTAGEEAYVDVSRAVKGVVVSPLLLGEQPLLDVLALALQRVDALGRAHGHRGGELGLLHVHAGNVPMQIELKE